MSKYADVIKGAKDLLSKSYTYSNKVELKTSSASGVTYTAEATVSKPSAASLKAEYAKGNFKVDKLSIGSDKKIAGEFSLTEALPATKLTFKATDGTRAAGAAAISAAVGAEYKYAYGTVTVEADVLSYNLDASALFAYDGFLVGASGKAALAKGFAATDYNVALGYKTKEFTAGVQTDKKASAVSAFYHHAVSKDISAAAIAKFPLAFAAAPSAFDIEAGVSYKAAADTTVHAKVNSAGKVAVSYAQVLSPLAKVTFAGEVDAGNIASDDHKFGIQLNFTA